MGNWDFCLSTFESSVKSIYRMMTESALTIYLQWTLYTAKTNAFAVYYNLIDVNGYSPNRWLELFASPMSDDVTLTSKGNRSNVKYPWSLYVCIRWIDMEGRKKKCTTQKRRWKVTGFMSSCKPAPVNFLSAQTSWS